MPPARPQHRSKQTLPFPGPVLRGAATCHLDVKVDSEGLHNSGNTLQRKKVKSYWPEESRWNEVHVINTVRERLPADMIKYLPEVIAWHDVPSSSTENILSELECAIPHRDSNNPMKSRHSRVLRQLLFRKLVPLHQVDSVDNIMLAIKDTFMCHFALWQKGVQHRDITVSNIMWDDVNGCGVLEGWDQALIAGIDESKACTGRLPFLARDLLGKTAKVRRYYHEVESFIWVLAWICIYGTPTGRVVIERWCQSDRAEVKNAKICFVYYDYLDSKLNEEVKELEAGRFEDAWEKCKRLMRVLHRVDGIRAFPRDNHGVNEPDEELLYKAFMAVMDGSSEADKLPLYHIP